MTSNQFEVAEPPGDAVTTLSFAPTENSHLLLVSSWDLNVYLYDTSTPSSTTLLRRYAHPAPVLAACFGANDTTAYTASLDFAVRKIDLSSGEQTILSIHSAPASSLAYDPAHDVLYSASWDKTLHVHHVGPTHATSIPATITLPNKPLSLALSPSKLVVSMTARLLHIYDLAAAHHLTASAAQPPPNAVAAQPLQQRESALKFMVRAMAARPDDSGYVCASIEGRVAVEWFDASPEAQARKYAFKCHRQPGPGGDDVVYPVHAVAFHPEHPTFATGGGDGVVALWDAVNKRRIRQYQKFPTSVAGVAFRRDGRVLAVGVCDGFEDGGEAREDEARPAKLFVRELAEGECKGKEKK